MPQQNWREEFDEKFFGGRQVDIYITDGKGNGGYFRSKEELKAFIETLLARVIEAVPGIAGDDSFATVSTANIKAQLRSEFGIKEGR